MINDYLFAPLRLVDERDLRHEARGHSEPPEADRWRELGAEDLRCRCGEMRGDTGEIWGRSGGEMGRYGEIRGDIGEIAPRYG